MSLLPLDPHLPGALPPDRRATPQPAGGRLRAAPPEGGLHAPLHPPDELSLPISGLTYPNTTLVSDKSRRARCEGKGRKSRCTPLREDAAAALSAWIDEQRPGPEDPLFPSSRGGQMSTDAVGRLVAKHVRIASSKCPSIAEKNVTPHTLRHSAAMALRERGVDLSVIALWLGHESLETTQMYLHADVRLKEQALARTVPIGGTVCRFNPREDVLAYLESL